MAKTLGYRITWTTYGTWLQGDERGYVKNARIYPGNKSLCQSNERLKVRDAVKLTNRERQLVRTAIVSEAQLHSQHIYALSVQPTHIHIVLQYIPQPISKIVAYYKKAGRLVLKPAGRSGKLWTRGYDKRFCFDRAALQQKIKYVKAHNSSI